MERRNPLKRISVGIFFIYLLLLMAMLLSPRAASAQVPGQPASRGETWSVLGQLIDAEVIGLGILIGEQAENGSFNLIFHDDEICGSLVARRVEAELWLESLVLLPPASQIRQSIDAEHLRHNIYQFFGGDPEKDWHDGAITASEYRTDVYVQRSSRTTDNLVVEFMFLKGEPTQLIYLKVISWPAPLPVY